ncbi:hypothetical protein [Streptomyces sp. CHB9.2]|uniref:hypothetical protein n=1 Tax=Streptomyces sp. CHB9.2 TaxID=2841670 RepID=UPI0020964794|nr:hypothetical protein [Streptomyces sp. CHB9.2]MCO6704767.1 hypothetical protein [Streptomyces sp. CHB9.2]
MSMQATTIPGYAPINFVIADCESNWGRWQQLLPLGRSFPIDYLWRDIEEGLPHSIELDARFGTIVNMTRMPREQTQTYVLIPTDEEMAELKAWLNRPREVPQPGENESVGDALRRMRDVVRNGALSKLMRTYKIPEKAIFVLSNSAILLDDEVLELRFCQRGQWYDYLNNNHTRGERGWIYKEPEAS